MTRTLLILVAILAAMAAAQAADQAVDVAVEQAVEHTAWCAELQVQARHGGLEIGQAVQFTPPGGSASLPGRVLAFRCAAGLTGDAAALIERTDNPRRPWTYVVPLQGLRR